MDKKEDEMTASATPETLCIPIVLSRRQLPILVVRNCGETFISGHLTCHDTTLLVTNYFESCLAEKVQSVIICGSERHFTLCSRSLLLYCTQFAFGNFSASRNTILFIFG